MATFTKLKSGSWRAQIRRKGQYVSETFLRRKDAEEWALDMERRIDRQEPAITRRSRDAKRFRDLIALHRQDMTEVGVRIGRSKDFCLTAIGERLGVLRIAELDRERLIRYGKDRAKEGAGRSRSAWTSDISRPCSPTPRRSTACPSRPNPSISRASP